MLHQLTILKRSLNMSKTPKSIRTKAHILSEGLKLWQETNGSFTKAALSKRVELTRQAIDYHFQDDVFDAIAAHAVETGCDAVVAQLIVMRHPAVQGMTAAEREDVYRRSFIEASPPLHAV